MRLEVKKLRTSGIKEFSDLKLLQLASRDATCINSIGRKHKGSSLITACLNLRKNNNCSAYNQIKLISQEEIFNTYLDIEELIDNVDLGISTKNNEKFKFNFCPFFAARDNQVSVKYI